MWPHIQVQSITKDKWHLLLEMFRRLQGDVPISSSLLVR
jgi:hypothetical protein